MASTWPVIALKESCSASKPKLLLLATIAIEGKIKANVQFIVFSLNLTCD